jgi:DNA-binding NarL/FixJ family response regulator
MPHIRVFLVDDNLEFLEAATNFLKTDPQLEVVGRATSGHEALEQVAALQPDLVLIDLTMPDMSGLEATQQLKSQPNAPRVAILTLHDNPEYRIRAETVHADGFVPKSEVGTQLLPLIHALCPLD